MLRLLRGYFQRRREQRRVRELFQRELLRLAAVVEAQDTIVLELDRWRHGARKGPKRMRGADA